MELPIFNIVQIYFNEQTRLACSNHPYVKPFDNSEAQIKWFENEVIANEIVRGGIYYGVWSHKAISKIRQAGNKHFDFEQLESRLANAHRPVIAFHKNHRKLVIFHNSESNYLPDMANSVMEHLGFRYRAGNRVECGIMQNHFLMHLGAYKHYQECLRKAMDFIDSELNDKASKRSPYKPNSPVFYTWHTFILERLASAFVDHYRLPFHYYKDLKHD